MDEAPTFKLIDGQARQAATAQRMYRLISSKDGSPIKNVIKIGRNDPCPCKSGKKFKNCHQDTFRNMVSE